jgi:hypothetical protein
MHVLAPLDGPAQHTRSASRSTNPPSIEVGAVRSQNPSSTTVADPASSIETSSDVQSMTAPESLQHIGQLTTQKI